MSPRECAFECVGLCAAVLSLVFVNRQWHGERDSVHLDEAMEAETINAVAQHTKACAMAATQAV
jgi:hypothetical protein